jgi:hypothetical protein
MDAALAACVYLTNRRWRFVTLAVAEVDTSVRDAVANAGTSADASALSARPV